MMVPGPGTVSNGAGEGPGGSGAEGEPKRRVVVLKVGTSSLVDEEVAGANSAGGLRMSRLSGICEAAAALQREGCDVVLVSSGAVGVGCEAMRLEKPPVNIAKKQALAAVGQGRLIGIYESVLGQLHVATALVLLTLENLADESQYKNVRSTFQELFALGVIPIVNENDTVAVRGLRFGDNDTLASMVASMVGAEMLFLLTDVDAIYTSNPSVDPSAQPIRVVEDLKTLNVDVGGGGGSGFGTGGMYTKLVAARLAAAAGCHTVISNARHPEHIPRIMRGEPLGTLIKPLPQDSQARGRKRWILGVPSRGEVWLDLRGCQAVVKGKSLHANMVTRTSAKTQPFTAYEAVTLCSEDGLPLAKGLSNYSAEEVDAIKGLRSSEVHKALGFSGPAEVFYRGNIALLEAELPGRRDDVQIRAVPSWGNLDLAAVSGATSGASSAS